MTEHTAGSAEVTELSIAGSLDVNFHLLKKFEDEKHKLMKSPGLNFLLFTWLLRNYNFTALQIIIAHISHIFLKFSHLRFLQIEKYIMI